MNEQIYMLPNYQWKENYYPMGLNLVEDVSEDK